MKILVIVIMIIIKKNKKIKVGFISNIILSTDIYIDSLAL